MEHEVEQLRRFNRTVTQRVGALDDAFLSRARPLGQARLLWEIGAGPSELRALRARLDLDSGYLSRLLQALQADGLVRVEADERDGRVRVARLTEAGHTERAELDRLSDDRAAAILRPLDERQRSRLVTAMGEVERLFVASMVDVAVADPRSPEARHAQRCYGEELSRRFPEGYDAGLAISASDDELTLPAGLLLVATLHGEAVGCAALKLRAGNHDGTAHAKRVWVAPAVRGLGLGRRILAELEAKAAEHGARTIRLDTHRSLTEAIRMYRTSGYREVPPFNDEYYAHHWFEKPLSPEDSMEDDLRRRFTALTTAHVADACLRLAVPVRCAPAGTRALTPGDKVFGPAVPCRHVGSVDMFLEAFGSAPAGSVLVVDNGGRTDESCVGDLVALEAKDAGLAGIVIWGLHRDTADLRAIGLPVFSLGTLPTGPQRLDPRPADALSAARSGEWTVTADDLVLGDSDGVLYVPAARAAELFDLAESIRDTEHRQAARIRSGESLRAQVGFAAYLAARAERPELTFREHLRAVGGAIEE
jgi:regulator of RNase E activity RraA/DNA-binding MarR family transcriptional regulator/ribosomal protein S18 acetylase RimI-like enzyme